MKKIKLFLVLSIGSLLSVSCLVDDDVDQLGGGDSAAIGFESASLSPNFVTDGQDYPYVIPVNVVGGNKGLPSNSEVTVSWEFASTSTATQGLEFEFDSPARTVVLPAGSFSTGIPITVLSENLVVGDDKTVVINLTSVVSNEGVVLATNHKTVVVNLVGACFSDLAGQYYWNYTSGPVVFTVTEISPGFYSGTQFPFFSAAYSFRFTDVCDVLTMTTWQFQGDNPLYGTNSPMPVGTVLPNGDLRFTGINVTGTTVSNQSITAYKVR